MPEKSQESDTPTMTKGMMPTQAEFVRLVKDALKHLHDYPYLEKHPLAAHFWPESSHTGPNRGQRLHRLLIEGIEALNPRPGQALESDVQLERYLILVYRYMDGQSPEAIMQELSCSRRQYFRQQHQAVVRLAAHLWEKLPAETPAPTTNDLLTAEAERILVQREAVPPDEIVQGVLAAVRMLAEQHGASVECDVPPSLPHVHGSRTVLRQVLLRILGDLIVQSGSRHILLRMRPGRRAVEVQVVADAERRAGQPEGMHRPSSAFAQRLVELMGGRWHAWDAAGAGCRFSLPCGASRTVLAIEDNEAVVMAYRRYLVGYGYQVVGTANGEDALRMARELEPAAITLDIMMPTQDGWEILQALKNDPTTREVPVIICSVVDDPDLARSLGAAEYLRKPVSQSDLISALSRVVGRPGGDP